MTDIRVAGEERGGWQRPVRRLVLLPDARDNPLGHVGVSNCYEGRCQTSPVPPGRYWAVIVPIAVQARNGAGDVDIRTKLGPWGKEIDLVPGENRRIEIAPVPERVVKKMEEF